MAELEVGLVTYDAIVIGVGGMGSATAYHLARRGAKTLALEQFNIPNNLGASHGVNRIIRLAYAEDPSYVPLLRRAYELWRDLEKVAREQLLFITGGVDAGPLEGEIVKGSLRACGIHKLTHEVLDADSLHDKFPGFRLASDMVAVYQPDGGFVLSERSIVAHVTAALELGAHIHGREKVLSWRADGAEVRVKTDRSEYDARRLIITAGPWAASVVKELAALAIPERQVLAWIEPLRPDYFCLGAFPVFNMEGPEGRFYGFPIYGVPGFKIGKYHHRKELVMELSHMDRDCHPEDELVLREGIRRYFPDANGPTMALETCLFTNSPDEHFIIDRHPRSPKVFIAAGFSGHGFKFCSVVGEILADLALKGQTHWNISLFQLARFTNLTSRG